MLTRWGRALDRDRPLPEYPRPQLVRGGWVNLNGVWDHAFTTSPDRPSSYDGPIVVPFSPEAELSGVGRQLQPDEWLWYRRSFTAPDPPPGGRVLLHFGAVDQSCTVWVNGHEAGSHTGGYLPFTLDVTDHLPRRRRPRGPGAGPLRDRRAHAGKQRLDRGKIWYTAQSGIWQTVWLEAVPASYVERLVLTPHLDSGELEVTVVASGCAARGVGSGGGGFDKLNHRRRSTTVGEATLPPGIPVRIPLRDIRPWSPADPHLYDVEVTLGEDRVSSYAALRSFGVGRDDDGHARLLLNGDPITHVGVLDQGYWPDGLLTPPSDAAMVHDIETMKSLGFNVLRKHAKVEPLRWYAHCDRLGMLVWQDIVNGGGRYRALTTTRPARKPDRVPDRLHRLYARHDRTGGPSTGASCATPSTSCATPCRWPCGRRSTRGGASSTPTGSLAGWRTRPDPCGQPGERLGGPGRRRHPELPRLPAPVRDARARRWARPWRHDRRAVALTEYGGFSMRVEGHDWSPREFGYRHFDDARSLAGVRRAARAARGRRTTGLPPPSTPSSATSRTS